MLRKLKSFKLVRNDKIATFKSSNGSFLSTKSYASALEKNLLIRLNEIPSRIKIIKTIDQFLKDFKTQEEFFSSFEDIKHYHELLEIHKKLVSSYDFTEKIADVKDVGDWIRYVFSPNRSSPQLLESAKGVVDEFNKDNKSVQNKLSELDKFKRQVHKTIFDVQPSPEEMTEEFLLNLGQTCQSSAKTTKKINEDIQAISTKFFHTYWHSEQKLFQFLMQDFDRIMKPIVEQLQDNKAIAIFLNLYSKYDICTTCSKTLVIFSALQDFRQKMEKCFSTKQFKIFTSFRDKTNK
jgi:hypothetical protein